MELVGDDYRELRGEIAGPPDTPYEGATFQLEIKVPETYPFNPPKVTCYMVELCFAIFTEYGVIFILILTSEMTSGKQRPYEYHYVT